MLWIWAGTGCHGVVGVCAGEGCPRLPGCEDNPITCDPDHICEEQVCEGVAWICGLDQQGYPSWLNKSAPCDDGDPCTINDLCVEGRCVGTEDPCDRPPDNTCVDGSTLRAWDSKGSCTDSQCNYTSNDFTCPKGCQGGMCIGSPCTGIKCDKAGPCEKSPGTCVAGHCTYEKLRQGSPCTLADSCISGATCDAQGNCVGTKVDCSRDHTIGGTCVKGTCQGFSCEKGWGNCNKTWDDGCEKKLDTVQFCGSCTNACGSVAHGSPSCAGGKCVATCNQPYQDCDKSYGNGCERKVGVPNTCNRQGMASWSGSTPPCGTPHCGSSTSKDAANFGSWYCLFCSHCQKKPNGYYAWCLKSYGYFSPDNCIEPACGCDPNSSTYPQTCNP